MSSHPARKTVVLDTSVLIAAGKQPLFAFEGQRVVIPLIVLRELEKLRNDPERGYTARIALRAINALNSPEDGETKNFLNQGVSVDKSGGTVAVELNHIDESKLPATLKSGKDNDMRVLAVAVNLREEGEDVVLISNDLPLRVLASSVEIPAEEFIGTSLHDHGGEFTGMREELVPKDTIDALYRDGEVKFTFEPLDDEEFFGVNFGVVLTALEGGSSALAVVSHYDKFMNIATLRPVKNGVEAFGLKPHSAEQKVALNHLLNKDIDIVSLGGRAGTGKTALALGAALEQIIEDRDSTCPYKKIVVFRSPHAVGQQELGYLPGDGDEKMAPWAAAVYDALSSFCSETLRSEIEERRLIEVLPMTHIRGRSLNGAFVIIDEAQNLELPVLMTAISRIGRDSKVVLTWDIAQRDNLRVGRHNGVVAAVNEMVGDDIFAHTTLIRSERSKVAMLASQVLEKLQQ